MEKANLESRGRKAAFFALVGVSFAAIWIYNFLTPLMSDDLLFRPSDYHSIWDIFRLEYEQYMTWNGRSVLQIILKAFSLMPKWVFDLCNSLCFVFLLLLIYFNVGGRKKYDGLLYVFINLLVWNFSVEFDQTVLWMGGACNYLWGIVILLGFLTCLRYFLRREGGKKAGRGKTIGLSIFLFFFGALAGWGNENTSGGGILIALFYAFFTYFDVNLLPKRKGRSKEGNAREKRAEGKTKERSGEENKEGYIEEGKGRQAPGNGEKHIEEGKGRQAPGNREKHIGENRGREKGNKLEGERKRISPWIIAGLAGMVVGFLFLLLAPGNRERGALMLAEESYSGIMAYVSRGLKINKAINSYMMIYITVICLLSAYFFYKYKGKRLWGLRDTFRDVFIFSLAGLATSYVLVLTPEPMPRAYFGANIFFAIACIRLVWRIPREEVVLFSLKVGGIAAAVIWMFFSYTENGADLARIKREVEEREAYILEQTAMGNRELTLPMLRPEFQTEYSFMYENDISTEKSFWINEVFCIKYGLESIDAVPREEWDD